MQESDVTNNKHMPAGKQKSPIPAQDRSGSHMSDDVFSDFVGSFDKNTSGPPLMNQSIITAQPTSQADSAKSLYTTPPLVHSETTAKQTDNETATAAKVSGALGEAHGGSQHDSTPCTSPQAIHEAAKVIVSPGVTQLMPVKYRKTSVIQQSFSPSPNSSPSIAVTSASATAFRYPSPPPPAAVSTARTSTIANPEPAQIHIVRSRSSLPPARNFPTSLKTAPSYPSRQGVVPATASHLSSPLNQPLNQHYKLLHQKHQPQLPQSIRQSPPLVQAQANNGSILLAQPQRRMQVSVCIIEFT